MKGSLYKLLANGLIVSCNCLALTTSLISGSRETPLLELAFVSLAADIQHKDLGIVGHLKGDVLINVFSNIKVGWEAMLERWPFEVQMIYITDE